MRIITLIIVHCSAVRPWQKSGVTDIDRWHRARGWKNGCGYHFVVRRDGTVETGRPLAMVGAHCQNHNKHSIGICYEGGLNTKGLPSDTRTEDQKIALRQLLERLHTEFPNAIIVGHNTFSPMKSCPCFDAVAEYADLQPA
ncbi:MAG: N-acetylmuramoyl-L-alanine amidase [Bacteroidales bacterium]|nr:N-acetylmuramoyl-L-alanine amidase [Bacteroidales bacterium]